MKNLNNFKLQEIYQEDKNTFRGSYSFEDSIIRAEVISKMNSENALQNITAEISRAKGLYADAPAPYPGVISDKIVCDKEFVPEFNEEEVNKVKISYFTGFMTERLTFGACSKEEAFYKGQFALFYCPGQKKMYQLEIIAPKNDFLKSPEKFEGMLKSISCKI